MHSQFYSLSSGPPSSLSPHPIKHPRENSSRSAIARNAHHEVLFRGCSSSPRALSSRRAMPPSGSPGSLCFLRASSVACWVSSSFYPLIPRYSFFFFVRERNKRTHTHTRTKEKGTKSLLQTRRSPTPRSGSQRPRENHLCLPRAPALISSKQHTNDEC